MQDARQIPRSQKAAGGAIMGFLGLVELRHTKVFLCYDIHGTALSPALVPYTGRLRAVPRLKQTHRSGGSPKEKLMNTTTSYPPHGKENQAMRLAGKRAVSWSKRCRTRNRDRDHRRR
jgi:hypothetical protein